ncbi:hypothetical protein HN903_02620 [archaeon]|jgi:hypothetical protein|nr:hypothetical protein [archaeon]MBT7128626.1 hypothetical protein [archaeon]
MSVSLVENGAALQSMRNSDFDAYSAYGEIIDNSIQADAKIIRVHFDYVPATTKRDKEGLKYVAFGDDGEGMEPDVLHRCLQLGYSSRYNDRSGIGRFGVGGILAAINQCMKIEMYSKVETGDWLYTYVDLGQIMKGEMSHIPEPIVQTPPDEFLKFSNPEHGTIAIWSKYDRQPTNASEIVYGMHIWTGRTYRYFLWEDTKIVINDKDVLAIDPLYCCVEKTKHPETAPANLYDPIEISWPIAEDDRIDGGPSDSEITIKMSLLPEELRPNRGAGNSNNAKDRYIDKNEGFSIIRNKREVFFGRIPYWPGKPIQEIDRWWGCEISFDAVLDKEFTVKNIKRGAVPVKELKKALKDKIEPTRNTCLGKVREHWDENKAKSKINDKDNTTETGHEKAEKAAQKTKTPKNIIDKKKNINEEAEKVSNQWAEHADEQQRRRWEEKFKSQPFSLLDDEWKGPEFFETTHMGGSSVLKYNKRHDFFRKIDEIRVLLHEKNDDNDDDAAEQLKDLIDLLLISYAKAEAMFDDEFEMSAEKFIEQIRMSWGNYLSNYIGTYEKQNQTE